MSFTSLQWFCFMSAVFSFIFAWRCLSSYVVDSFLCLICGLLITSCLVSRHFPSPVVQWTADNVSVPTPHSTSSQYQPLNWKIEVQSLLVHFQATMIQFLNLLCAEANSASYPRRDEKWVVAYGLPGECLVWLIWAVLSVCCTIGPVVC